MTTTILKCQFIANARGNPIGVILPLEEFSLIENILEQRLPLSHEANRLNQTCTERNRSMEQAANDPLFMADLHNTMSAFAEADAEWWEPAQ